MPIVSVFVVVILVFAVGLYFMQSSGGKKRQSHTEKNILDDSHDTVITTEEHLPYKKHDYLMSIPERQFFDFLNGILPENYVAYPQVLLSKIVQVHGVKKWEKGSRYNARWSKINKKTIDFVVFSLPYYQPVVCIEYDGKTHDKPDRHQRDVEVANILGECGMDLIHIRHGKTTPREAKEIILPYLS